MKYYAICKDGGLEFMKIFVDKIKVDSWWRWLFFHCSYCLCKCDAPGPTSDRFLLYHILKLIFQFSLSIVQW